MQAKSKAFALLRDLVQRGERFCETPYVAGSLEPFLSAKIAEIYLTESRSGSVFFLLFTGGLDLIQKFFGRYLGEMCMTLSNSRHNV